MEANLRMEPMIALGIPASPRAKSPNSAIMLVTIVLNGISCEPIGGLWTPWRSFESQLQTVPPSVEVWEAPTRSTGSERIASGLIS